METTLPKTARFVIDAKGRKKEILLPVAALDELLEDAYDAGVARSRLEDDDVPWAVAMKTLRSNGQV
jgi:hypothetical protein